jgi:hypothetical protein
MQHAAFNGKHRAALQHATCACNMLHAACNVQPASDAAAAAFDAVRARDITGEGSHDINAEGTRHITGEGSQDINAEGARHITGEQRMGAHRRTVSEKDNDSPEARITQEMVAAGACESGHIYK